MRELQAGVLARASRSARKRDLQLRHVVFQISFGNRRAAQASMAFE